MKMIRTNDTIDVITCMTECIDNQDFNSLSSYYESILNMPYPYRRDAVSVMLRHIAYVSSVDNMTEHFRYVRNMAPQTMPDIPGIIEALIQYQNIGSVITELLQMYNISNIPHSLIVDAGRSCIDTLNTEALKALIPVIEEETLNALASHSISTYLDNWREPSSQYMVVKVLLMAGAKITHDCIYQELLFKAKKDDKELESILVAFKLARELEVTEG